MRSARIDVDPDRPRRIFHVDLDAFFASVEQRDNPQLRGLPVLVGGSSRRGVVAAASYEARAFGCHSAMPMARALRLCPGAIVVRHHMDRYQEASRAFVEILRDFSPAVEPISVDEAFIDMTGSERLFGDARSIGRAIKQRIRAELELVASVGSAPTKFAAKIASDIDKPDGLRVVEAEELDAFLRPLPVGRLWGVGKVARADLESMGLRTIGDVARYPEPLLVKRLGSLGRHLAALARGEDQREVTGGQAAVSIGHEETLEHDATDRAQLSPLVIGQSDAIARRLRRAALEARTVTLKVKYACFRLITRSRTLSAPTSDGAAISECALAMLREVEVGVGAPVRLIGTSTTGLRPRGAPRQLDFSEEERERRSRLGSALDDIADRFGGGAIRRAGSLRE